MRRAASLHPRPRKSLDDALDEQTPRSPTIPSACGEESWVLRSPPVSPSLQMRQFRSPSISGSTTTTASPFSDVSRGSCGSETPSSFVSPRARLRGPGQVIGTRGRASGGIPWRQIPIFTPLGALKHTGAALQEDRNEVPMGRKSRGQFSSKLGEGSGIRDVFETDDGRCKPKSGSPEAEQRENQRNVAGERSMKRSMSDDSLHWAFRQQRKGVTTDCKTKEFCPYHREDSIPESRAVQPPTPNKRNSLSPSASLKGGVCTSPADGAQPRLDVHAHSAEKLCDARRDWHYQKGLDSVRSRSDAYSQEAFMESSQGGGSLTASVLKRGVSPRTFSARSGWQQSLATLLEGTVHSIRARPSAAMQRPRWRG